MKKHKILGQVYTPEWIVEEILNLINYKGEKILGKKIIVEAIKNEEIIQNKKDFNINNLLPLVKQNGVTLIEYNELKENFSAEIIDFLKRHSDFDRFINAFVNLTKGKTYGK